MIRALNLGCGNRYHRSWVNIDFSSTSSDVTSFDLSKGIPFADNCFDLAYHSHLLEHFPREKAFIFLAECFRVLRPGGVLRVVVPDLEAIARAYLLALEEVISATPGSVGSYDWVMLELFDQTVRSRSGGAMAVYLQQESLPNADFVIQRIGVTAKEILSSGKQKQELVSTNRSNLKSHIKRFTGPLYQFLHDPSLRWERFLQILLGSEYDTLQVGRFRQSGEVHQWMYDRYSLKRLLEHCGFSRVVQRSATDSYIENWPQFNLDTEPDGSIYKPDSLYMEAVKL